MNRQQIVGAIVVVLILPQILLWPFQSQLQQLVPHPTVWQSIGMLLGLVLVFALSVTVWNQRLRLNAQQEGERAKYRATSEGE